MWRSCRSHAACVAWAGFEALCVPHAHTTTLLSTATQIWTAALILKAGTWLMQDVPPVYDLYAVSNHFGGMGGGHYNAYCKMPDGNWWCFDDSHVHAVDKDKICSSSAYVLFYRRRHEAQQDTGLHCTTVPKTLHTLLCSVATLPCIYCTTQQFTTLRCLGLHCDVTHTSALHCISTHSRALQCTASYCHWLACWLTPIFLLHNSAHVSAFALGIVLSLQAFVVTYGQTVESWGVQRTSSTGGYAYC